MTEMAERPEAPTSTYELEGRLLEVCDCNVLCPCWIGEDPDNGTCDAIVAWAIDKGEIEGVDVSGRTVAMLGHIPGNILEGNWTAAVFVDDESTEEQQEAMLKVFTGQLGGGRLGEYVSLRDSALPRYQAEADVLDVSSVDGDEALKLVGLERTAVFSEEYNARLRRKLVRLVPACGRAWAERCGRRRTG